MLVKQTCLKGFKMQPAFLPFERFQSSLRLKIDNLFLNRFSIDFITKSDFRF